MAERQAADELRDDIDSRVSAEAGASIDVTPANEAPDAGGYDAVVVGLFAGMNEPKRFSLPERLILKAVKAPQGDFRDYEAVSVWARAYARPRVGIHIQDEGRADRRVRRRRLGAVMDVRRWAFLLLALVLVVAFIPGCNGEAEDADTGDDGDETTEPADDGDEADLGTVSVMGVWGGGELESFQEVAAGWEDETGGTMEFESTRDLSAILTARVSGGNPPDVAILPNPALMQSFAAKGELQSVDFLEGVEDDYAETWIDQGTVDGTLYGLMIKASTKSTVWYDPAEFDANGYEAPTTWEGLIDLSDQMVADGNTPWSIGVESGGASGWPASDWIQEIYLAESGPDMYDQWTAHEIPWTDESVKSAFEHYGEIATDPDYVVGGVDNILATGFEDASYPPFQDPPGAYMYFLGSFTQGFIETQFPDQTAGEDYDFFKFVEIDPEYTGSVTGGVDVAVMFNDTPEARSFMEYMATASSWEPWAEAGGFVSPNQSFDEGAYPDELTRKAAEQITAAGIFRVDADDLMPAEVQSAYWSGILDYMQDPDSLDTILADIEEVAATAYAE